MNNQNQELLRVRDIVVNLLPDGFFFGIKDEEMLRRYLFPRVLGQQHADLALNESPILHIQTDGLPMDPRHIDPNGDLGVILNSLDLNLLFLMDGEPAKAPEWHMCVKGDNRVEKSLVYEQDELLGFREMYYQLDPVNGRSTGWLMDVFYASPRNNPNANLNMGWRIVRLHHKPIERENVEGENIGLDIHQELDRVLGTLHMFPMGWGDSQIVSEIDLILNFLFPRVSAPQPWAYPLVFGISPILCVPIDNLPMDPRNLEQEMRQIYNAVGSLFFLFSRQPMLVPVGGDFEWHQCSSRNDGVTGGQNEIVSGRSTTYYHSLRQQGGISSGWLMKIYRATELGVAMHQLGNNLDFNWRLVRIYRKQFEAQDVNQILLLEAGPDVNPQDGNPADFQDQINEAPDVNNEENEEGNNAAPSPGYASLSNVYLGRNSNDFVQERRAELGCRENFPLLVDDHESLSLGNSKCGHSNHTEGLSCKKQMHSYWPDAKVETMQDQQMLSDNKLYPEDLGEGGGSYGTDEVAVNKESIVQGNSYVRSGTACQPSSTGGHATVTLHDWREIPTDVRSRTSDMGWLQSHKDLKNERGSGLADLSYPKDEFKWQVSGDPICRRQQSAVLDKEQETQKLSQPSPKDLLLYYKKNTLDYQMDSQIPVTNLQDEHTSDFINLAPSVSRDFSHGFGSEAPSIDFARLMLRTTIIPKSLGAALPGQIDDIQPNNSSLTSTAIDGFAQSEVVNKSLQEQIPQNILRINAPVTVTTSEASVEFVPVVHPAKSDTLGFVGNLESEVSVPEQGNKLMFPHIGVLKEAQNEREQHYEVTSMVKEWKNVDTCEVRKASVKKSRKQTSSKAQSSDQAKEVSKPHSLHQSKPTGTEVSDLADIKNETHIGGGEILCRLSPRDTTESKSEAGKIEILNALVKGSFPAGTFGHGGESVDAKGDSRLSVTAQQLNAQVHAGQHTWKLASCLKLKSPLVNIASGKLLKPALLRDIRREESKKVLSVQLQTTIPAQKSRPTEPSHGSGPSWLLSASTPAKAASLFQIFSHACEQSEHEGDDERFWGPLDQPKQEVKLPDCPHLASQGSAGTKSSLLRGIFGGSLNRQRSTSSKPAGGSLSSSPDSAQSLLKGKKDAITKHSGVTDFRDWCESESVRLIGTKDTSFLEFCAKQSRSEAEMLLIENLGVFDPDHKFIDKFLNYKESLPADVLKIAFQRQSGRKATGFGAGDTNSEFGGVGDSEQGSSDARVPEGS